ncbi:hypothetical protein Tco_0733811 [Tanacetum coccineum]
MHTKSSGWTFAGGRWYVAPAVRLSWHQPSRPSFGIEIRDIDQLSETLLDQVMKVFGDSTPEDKAQSGLEVCRSTKGIRKTDQKKTEGHGDSACMRNSKFKPLRSNQCTATQHVEAPPYDAEGPSQGSMLA